MSLSCCSQLCLIVGDSRVVRQITRRMLEEAGLRVIEAADGLERLDAWGCHPDYSLFDWNMPRMNATDRLEAIEEECSTELPRVVLRPTENERDRITAAIETGAQELIMKPLEADILIGKMSDVTTPPGDHT